MRKLLITLFLLVTSSAYASGEVAVVIGLTGEAYAQRDGKSYQLKLKTPLFQTDILHTGAKSSLEVLFSDDSSLRMGAESTVAIDDFVYNSNTKPKLAVKVAKGAARVITGKIVEENRDGFVVKTPKATIGIRGTVLAVLVYGGTDKIILQQIGRAHDVIVTGNNNSLWQLNRPGQVLTIIDDAGEISNITQRDRDELSNSFGVTEGGENDNTGGNTQASAGTDILNNFGQTIDNINKPEGIDNLEKLPNNIIDNSGIPNLPDNPDIPDVPEIPTVVLATYLGGVSADSNIFTNTSFGFNADLTSGAISNAYVKGSFGSETAFDGTNFLVSGGSGQISNVNDANMSLTIENFGNKLTSGSNPSLIDRAEIVPGTINAGRDSFEGIFNVYTSGGQHYHDDIKAHKGDGPLNVPAAP